MNRLSEQTRLLVVAPHPDDETLGCGVLLQQVLAAGGEVHVVLMTDGDNNPWPQRYMERRLMIDDTARRRWGARRRSEVIRAMERLNVPVSVLHPLGWQDMAVTRRLRDDLAGSMAIMRSAILAARPNLVICPALRDSHPDHGAAHVLCRLALADMEVPPTLLTYPVHGIADASTYPIQIDATAAQQQRKLQAIAEHQTQMTLGKRRLRRLARSPERYGNVDTSAGDGRLPWQPSPILSRGLRLLVVTPTGANDWPWSKAPLMRDPSGVYRLQWPSGQAAPALAFAKLHLDWPTPWIFDHWGWHGL